MSDNISEQETLVALFKEHKTYIEDIKRKWLVGKRSKSDDVYEVMRPEEQEEVHRTMSDWERYITPIAETWWKERGYEVVWPESNSDPMSVRKIEDPSPV
jgi:hypothetical protein